MGGIIQPPGVSAAQLAAAIALLTPPTPATYVGQIANACGLPNFIAGTPNVQFMARSRHRAAVPISTATQMRIVLPGWYVPNTTFAETALGAPITYTAAIESAAGSILGQITFGGATSGTRSTIGNVISDAALLSSTILSGTDFFVRFWGSCATGFPYWYPSTLDTANGEGLVFSAAEADTTMTPGGNVGATLAEASLRPLAIVGNTTVPSVYILGDSRAFGYDDAHTAGDNAGDQGEIARALGLSNIPYVNGGVPGDSIAHFLASYAQRVALADQCSHGVMQMGYNDIVAGEGDTNLRAYITTARTLLPAAMPVFISTLSPGTNSTDNWQTQGNQTVSSPLAFGTGPREQHNDWRRTVPPLFAGCFDVANVTESGLNTGKWRTNGAANAWTVEGVHPSPSAYLAIGRSGAVDTSLIHF